jgi:hypothetical protein
MTVVSSSCRSFVVVFGNILVFHPIIPLIHPECILERLHSPFGRLLFLGQPCHYRETRVVDNVNDFSQCATQLKIGEIFDPETHSRSVVDVSDPCA